MDFHLKQWRNQQHESSDQQPPSGKLPKLLLDPHQTQLQPPPPSGPSALPLFASEPASKLSYLSAYSSDSTPTTTTRLPRMGSYFSLAQWQELELQALIFRHMLAGAAVPPELLHLIKKSCLSSSPPPYYLPHPLQHYPNCQPALMQSGYWERAAMDPEPGRCRRTDGKKWRCSRDVVAGNKYCERHMHRGRNRSRKPVEIPTPTASNPAAVTPSTGMAGGATHFALSGSSPSIDLLHLNQRSLGSKTERESLFGIMAGNEVCEEDGKSGGRILRHFFDDWPRSLQEPDNGGGSSNAISVSSATGLSISIPGNPPSDFSLKLSTGTNGEEAGHPEGNVRREQAHLNWPGPGSWGSSQMGPMGGPLAEALRSSMSNSSPTSVLHRLPRVSTSDASYVTT